MDLFLTQLVSSLQESLKEIKLDNAKTIDLENFFSKATQSQSWYAEEENKQVAQYRALVQWLKTNLTDLRVYKMGDVNIDVYVIGRLDGRWIVLRTKAVET